MRHARIARPLAAGALLLALALVAAACSDGGDDGDGDPGEVRVLGEDAATTGAATGTATAPDAAATEVAPSPLEVRLVEAFDGRGFDRPVELGVYPAPAGLGPALFVAEQDGRIFLLRGDGEGDDELLLDLDERVTRQGNEEGLLSVAVDPLFAENGHLWVYYSARGTPRFTRLSRFSVDLNADPFRADPASELVIIEVEQPAANHNGGAIRFGPDGMLYLGYGDGGFAGDPQAHGQNVATLLGSMIRIDVRDASAAAPYAIPADNPFVGVAGAREEIWAFGLRNPWRSAFDPDTGTLWVGDVGQGVLEEIDVIERGGNYGWRLLEGSRCFEPPTGCEDADTVLPVAEYDHRLGCSITGGVVYRGSAVPALAGSYLFADFCSGRVWALPTSGGAATQIARSPRDVVSFGTDAAGEVYLLTFDGPVLRIAE
jgi:glucose/arabinose dehydrogenase